MQKQLKTILEEVRSQINEAAAPESVEEIRVKVLGKKGRLTEILRSMGSLNADERKEVGKLANEVRSEIETILDNKRKDLKEIQKKARFRAEKIDVTEPGKVMPHGVKHPLTQISDMIILIQHVRHLSLVRLIWQLLTWHSLSGWKRMMRIFLMGLLFRVF